jgi:WD40 repeat protein
MLAVPYVLDAEDERLATVELWDADGRNLRGTLAIGTVPADRPDARGPQSSFSPDSKSVAVSYVGGTTVWDTVTQEPRATVDGCAGDMSDPQFSPDGFWVAVKCWSTGPGDDDTIGLQSTSATPEPVPGPVPGPQPGPPEPQVTFLSGKQASVTDFGFLPSGALITSASPAAGTEVATLALWASQPANRLATTAFQLSSGATAAQLTRDGRLLTTRAEDGNVDIWDAATGRLHAQIQCEAVTGDDPGEQAVWPDPTGAIVACGVRFSFSAGDVSLHDVASGRRIATFAPPADGVVLGELAFSDDGRLLAVSYENPSGGPAPVVIWNVADNRVLATLEPDPGTSTPFTPAIAGLEFSPDGAFLVGATPESIMVWSTSEWNEVTSIPVGAVADLAFSPDGSLLASGAFDGAVSLFDVPSWQPSGSAMTAHDAPLDFVRFSPAGLLVSHDYNDQTFFWDVGLRQAIGPIRNFRPNGFTTDGNSLVGQLSGDWRQVLHVSLSQEVWTATACRVANRNLTETEWQTYLPDEEYEETCAF